jgi:serine/threonine protein kinase
MLTGQVPFHEGDLTNKLRAHAQNPPPDPRQFIPDVPGGVVAVLQRMMAKKPDERYQTPAELLADLDRPGLCRKTVTADDLRSLAESAGSGPMPIVAPGGGAEGGVPSGSTMIESARHDSEEVRFESNRPKPRRAPPAKKPADFTRFEKADRIRAAVVFGAFAVIFAVGLWALSRLDTWFGGSQPPPPTAPHTQPTEDPATAEEPLVPPT